MKVYTYKKKISQFVLFVIYQLHACVINESKLYRLFVQSGTCTTIMKKRAAV